MQFAVLGPLLVTGPDGYIALPAGPAAAAVSWLLANANTQVSYNSLASVLWPDRTDPGHDAIGQAQAVARGIRTRLGDAIIITTRTHATIQVSDADVDAITFERLLDEAANRIGASDYAAATGRLNAALALWRGEPYRELRDAIEALPVINHLLERRNCAVEDIFGLRLHGRVDYAIVADLRAELTRSPDRPRLKRQLALALYRTGRQVESLELLRTHQDDVHDMQTAALYQAILRHDPSLDRVEQASPDAL